MKNEVKEALQKVGFTEEDIDNLPLPFQLSEKMANASLGKRKKRRFFPSKIHGTKRLPQNKFYKKISNFANSLLEYE